MEEISKKICGHCKQEKQISDFHKNKLIKDGFSRSCKDCGKVAVKKSQEKSRKIFLEKGESSLQVTKTCKGCNQEKEIKHFCIDKMQSDNLNKYCRDCTKIKATLYREENREQIRKNQVEHYSANREKCAKNQAERRKKNPERYRAISTRWDNKNRENLAKSAKKRREENLEKYLQKEIKYRVENKEKIKQSTREYARERKRIDPIYKLKTYLGTRLWYACKQQNTTKSNKTINLIGCSRQELRIYLESLFTEGMTWENYGKWHIDHKKPCAAFNLADPEEQKKCFHYTNLQPLWAKDNREKSSYYEGKKHFAKRASYAS